MVRETTLGNALNKAFEGKEISFPESRTDKQKYLDKIKGMSENDISVEFLKYFSTTLGSQANIESISNKSKKNIKELFNYKVKGLKNLDHIKFKNGVYKAIVNNVDKDGADVSIARYVAVMDDGKTQKKTLDYRILNRDLYEKRSIGDEIYVTINLNKETKKLTCEELFLSKGDICSVHVDKLNDSGLFISFGGYRSFIPKNKLKKDVKFGDIVYLKIKDVRVDEKNNNKNWLVFDVINKNNIDGESTPIDPVNNEKFKKTKKKIEKKTLIKAKPNMKVSKQDKKADPKLKKIDHNVSNSETRVA